MVRWNLREVGRSAGLPVLTLHPTWSSDDASFVVFTRKGQRLEDCTLDIELFDSEGGATGGGGGERRLTDFLGSVKLQGSELRRFVTADEIAW